MADLKFYFIPIIRSNLNLLQRQPSQPAPESSKDDSSPFVRSFTISGDVRLRNRQENKPVLPVTEPIQPVTEPVQPVTDPIEAVNEPYQSVTEPIQQATPETEAAGGAITDHKGESRTTLESRGEVSADMPLVLPSAQEGDGSSNLKAEREEVECVGGVVESGERDEEREEGKQMTGEVKEPSVEIEKEEEERVKSKLEERDNSGEAQSFLARSMSVEDTIRESPGFCFIIRPDLYKFAKV